MTASGSVVDATPSAFLGMVLDELVAEHTTDEVAVVAARKLYEERRGRVFEDEELWEVWSAGFVEWFVVEHVPEGATVPAATASLVRAREAGDVRRAAAIRAWLTSHRSLWSVEKLGAGIVELARLSDDDRAGADDQDRFDIGAAGHR